MAGFPQVCFIANTVKNPNIVVGDYTYYDDPEDSENFERNVLYHFPFIGDRLIIGKFCALARGVKFIMNGANHKLSGVGNDVWIGRRTWTRSSPATSLRCSARRRRRLRTNASGAVSHSASDLERGTYASLLDFENDRRASLFELAPLAVDIDDVHGEHGQTSCGCPAAHPTELLPHASRAAFGGAVVLHAKC
jgi:hypothetical protein